MRGDNILKLFEKVFGTHSDREIKKIRKMVDKVLNLDKIYQELSDQELRNKTLEFKERLANGETLDDILPEAFATVREASWRVLGLKPYEVQIIGGIILHQGRIAEMKTGEGKTLVATMPTYLNALEGKGAFVITVNDYLAKRDCEQMSKVYNFLNLSTGLVSANMELDDKREAYKKDIVYSTNNEIGFDYLRDNMVVTASQRMQRGFNYAIIDEIDSILIDEARTPLIISGAGDDLSENYNAADKFVRKLKGCPALEDRGKLESLMDKEQEDPYKDYDYVVDEKYKNIFLTDKGIAKAEKYYNIDNLGDIENIEINHYITIALKAHYIFKKDIDYVVRNREIVIVDEHTGRLMDGRRYSEGIHQAIETKEGVKVQKESKTLATISFQNLFRKFTKLSGMTGTAMTEEEEFRTIYGLDVVEIPTNKPVIRKDLNDKVYLTKKAKMDAIIERIKECNEKGQPMIVGTPSVEASEELSSLLKKNGIKHQVLNAKHHEREAEIIAQAGEYKSITIATNMAGRGTDIILGGNADFKTKRKLSNLGYSEELIEEATRFTETDDEDIINIRNKYKEIYGQIEEKLKPEAEKVKDLGGLYILGTERHSSRRIDNQLRGRSGRQGDPGVSEFIISLDDDLLRVFGVDKMKDIADNLNVPIDLPIDAKIINSSIERAQKRVEGMHYQSRKVLLEYDSVMELQRDIIYNQRNKIIDSDNIEETILSIIETFITNNVENSLINPKKITLEDQENINLNFSGIKGLESLPKYNEDELSKIDKDKIIDDIVKEFNRKYCELKNLLGEDIIYDFGKRILLFQIDFSWQDHIEAMDELKQGIGLRAIGQQDPIIAYKEEGFNMFEGMMNYIAHEVFRAFINTHEQYINKKQNIEQ